MIGCRCTNRGEGLAGLPIIDATECPIHPITCDAIAVETGIGCHHGQGHGDDLPAAEVEHSYLIRYSWRQGQPLVAEVM